MFRYMTIPEAALLWKIAPEDLRRGCEEKQIAGAVRFGSRWLIPANAASPFASGSYFGREDTRFAQEGA